MAISELLAVAFAAIAFGLLVALVKNDLDWEIRYGRVCGERNDLLMKPVIEADEKRREARRAAGIPDPDYIIGPFWSSTTTTKTTHKPRKGIRNAPGYRRMKRKEATK